jgi:hypothetical protein
VELITSDYPTMPGKGQHHHKRRTNNATQNHTQEQTMNYWLPTQNPTQNPLKTPHKKHTRTQSTAKLYV